MFIFCFCYLFFYLRGKKWYVYGVILRWDDDIAIWTHLGVILGAIAFFFLAYFLHYIKYLKLRSSCRQRNTTETILTSKDAIMTSCIDSGGNHRHFHGQKFESVPHTPLYFSSEKLFEKNLNDNTINFPILHRQDINKIYPQMTI